MNSNMTFRLFACCIPVRGARRSLICDLQRQKFRLIPNSLFDILELHSGETLGRILGFFEPCQHSTILDYFSFLEKHEYGFWTDEPGKFPPLSLEWKRPDLINNAIIDLDQESNYELHLALRQLEEVKCKFAQIRLFGYFSPAYINNIVTLIGKAPSLRYVELITRFNPQLTDTEIENFCLKEPRLSRVLLFSALEKKNLLLPQSGASVHYYTEAFPDHTYCGQVHHEYFSPTYECFLEAQRHNTCLNGKASIDRKGQICNCPSMRTSYGHITETTIAKVAKLDEFQNLWFINKDQIDICSDCEFRYICTDCRAFLKEPHNLLSKPERCKYDPYTATWLDS